MLAVLALLGAGCRSAGPTGEGISPTPVVPGTAATMDQPAAPQAGLSSGTAPAAAPPATAVPTASRTPAPPPSPTPSATPHPLFDTTIPGLRAREFPGGQVQILRELEQNQAFSRYYIAYPSGELTITGVMHVPPGSGPFPVLILLHGYFEREQYYAGADTWQAAEFFARQGYLVIAPDLRSWGESDPGLSLFHTGLVADVLHLISSLPSIPQADPARLGLWGHSMGGGITTKILTVDERPRAAVLYAPNSADDADLIARWGPGCLPGQSEAAGDNCNPGEFIPDGTSPEIIAAYLQAAADPAFLAQVAPINYLEAIAVPLQIHIGEQDGSRRQYTPPEWSAKLAAALQESGQEVSVYTYPDQGHYFEGEAWTSLLERSLELFDSALKPEG